MALSPIDQDREVTRLLEKGKIEHFDSDDKKVFSTDMLDIMFFKSLHADYLAFYNKNIANPEYDADILSGNLGKLGAAAQLRKAKGI